MSSILAKRPRDEDVLSSFDYGQKKTRLNQNADAVSANAFLSSRFPFQTTTNPLAPPIKPIHARNETSLNHVVVEGSPPNAFLQWREEKKAGSHSSLQARRPPTLTVDTAMDVDIAPPSPLPHGDNLSPWPANLTPSKSYSNSLQPSPIPHHLLSESLTISGGRTSTPIYSHFTWNSNPHSSPSSRDATSAASVSGKSQDTAENGWWRRRRLPSPISEAGDVPIELVKDIQDQPDCENTRFDSPSSMEVDNDIPSILVQEAGDQKLNDLTSTPPTTENMVTSSYAAPTTIATRVIPVSKSDSVSVFKREKIGFSMGFRADCEKCQMKVPGHYSHIVRS